MVSPNDPVPMPSELVEGVLVLLEAANVPQDVCDQVSALIETFEVKEGPLNSERWTLDALMTQLENWKRIASGRTCVSFECLCFGATSLWHQTHRDNFRAVDRKPEELSRWVLDHAGVVSHDFPNQVLEILQSLKAENTALKTPL